MDKRFLLVCLALAGIGLYMMQLENNLLQSLGLLLLILAGVLGLKIHGKI